MNERLLVGSLDELLGVLNDHGGRLYALDDVMEVEAALLQLEDDLARSRRAEHDMPLDALLQDLADEHDIDPGFIDAASELSDLSAQANYGDLADELLEHASEWLEELVAGIESLVEKLKAGEDPP